jgi:uncharacterized damage-inducible protein DinB
VNKSALDAVWNMTRQKYGIYLRLLEGLPEEELQERVIADMRTPVEMVAHASGAIVRTIAQGVATGQIEGASSDADVASRLKSREGLLAFAGECWRDADAAIAEVGDDELSRMVKTPWGMELRGGTAIHLLTDEFVHHRGQLYAFSRACGVAPPPLWSFDQNPEGFGP